jgi:archaellum component FlaC
VVLRQLKKEVDAVAEETVNEFRLVSDKFNAGEKTTKMISEGIKSLIEKIGEVEEMCHQIQIDTRGEKDNAKLEVSELE